MDFLRLQAGFMPKIQDIYAKGGNQKITPQEQGDQI
jgi:hypothetical protein